MFRTSQMKGRTEKKVTFSKSPCTHLGEEQWRSSSSDKAEEILQLYLTGKHSDCVFEIQFEITDEIVRFNCHSLILMTSSAVFEKLFATSKQNNDSSGKTIIQCPGLSPVAFDLIMRYVYGNKINLPDNIKFNIEICLKASVWDLDLLANAAEKQVLTMVKPENIVLVYEMYRRLGNTNRKLKCMNSIVGNRRKVFNSQNWLDASSVTVMDILFNSPQHDAASVVDLYNALILWGTAAASKTPLNLTIRFCVQQMLPLLHFTRLTYQQFAQLASKDTVLTEREKVSIFMRFPQFQKQ